MPTYLARGVSVRLGAMPLTDTVSQKIILRKGEAAKLQSDAAERQLRSSKLLKEVPVHFPGDEKRLHLNWLGNAPFIQVQTGWNFFSEERSDTVVNMTDVSAAREAKALVLHVNLSDRTYISGLRNQKTSLKIEVFFNGQLSNCWFMSTHDVRSGVRSHHQVFAGTRVDFLAERPWIILPPELTPDGSFKKDHKSVSVLQRWHDISQALQEEAFERGANDEEQVPPTARFLNALATMHMPTQVQKMQKLGGKIFGTIDVIITAGEGKKLTSGVGYLKAPKRMFDDNFPLKLKSDGVIETVRTTDMEHGESDTQSHILGLGHEAQGINAEDESHSVFSSPFKRRALMPDSLSMQDFPLSATPTSTHSTPEFARIFSRPHTQSTKELQSTSGESIYRMFSANPASCSSPPKDPLINSGKAKYARLLFPVSGTSDELAKQVPGVCTMPLLTPEKSIIDFESPQFSFPKEHHFEAANQSQKKYHDMASVPTRPTSVHQTSGFPSHRASGLPFLPPLSSHNRLTWPQPPVGLYSVTLKPTRSTFSRKESVSAKLGKTKYEIYVGKVVIMGKNQVILVERWFVPPKCVSLKFSRPVGPKRTHKSSTNGNTPSGLVEQVDKSAGLCKSNPSATQVNTPALMLSSEYQKAVFSSRDVQPVQSEDDLLVKGLLSYDHRHGYETSALENIPRLIEPKTNSMLALKQVSARYASPNNISPAVRSPKGDSSFFKGPEEIVCEAYAKLQGHAAVTATSSKSAGYAVQECSSSTYDTSSPLSSPWATREANVESMKSSPRSGEARSSVPTHILQADDSRKDRYTHINSPLNTSALRKRKTLHQATAQDSCSPRRSETNGNPVLNRDCVIAYAESKDKQTKQCVLRQVRGERLGVFREDYVVFATRFFVGEE